MVSERAARFLNENANRTSTGTTTSWVFDAPAPFPSIRRVTIDASWSERAIERATLDADRSRGYRVTLGGAARAHAAYIARALGATPDPATGWLVGDGALVYPGTLADENAPELQVVLASFDRFPLLFGALGACLAPDPHFSIEVPRDAAVEERLLAPSQAPPCPATTAVYGVARLINDHVEVTRLHAGRVVLVERVWSRRAEVDRYMAAGELLAGTMPMPLVEALADPYAWLDLRSRASDDEVKALVRAAGAKLPRDLLRIEHLVGGLVTNGLLFGVRVVSSLHPLKGKKDRVLFAASDSGDLRIYVDDAGAIWGEDDIEGGGGKIADDLEAYLAGAVATPLATRRGYAYHLWLRGAPLDKIARALELVEVDGLSTHQRPIYADEALVLTTDEHAARVSAGSIDALARAVERTAPLGKKLTYESTIVEVSDSLAGRGCSVLRNAREVLLVFSPENSERRGPYRAETRQRATASERLAVLGRERDTIVREDVAKHPNTDYRTLAALADDESWIVRQAVAAHPNTDAAIVQRLLRDPHHGVVEHALLRLPILPTHDGLVDHAHPSVRRTVALHPSTTPDELARLSADPRAEVRHAAAANPRNPALEALVDDPHPEVADTALANPACPAARLEKAIAEGRTKAAFENPRLPAVLLRQLVDKDFRRFSLGLMHHPVPDAPDLLVRFVESASSYELEQMLRRPDCPPEVVVAASRLEATAADAASHPNLPLDERARLTHHGDPEVRAAAHAPPMPRHQHLGNFWENRFLVVHPDAEVRATLARLPQTPRSVLLALATDPSPVVQAALAERSPAQLAGLQAHYDWSSMNHATELAMHPDAAPGLLVALARPGIARDLTTAALRNPSFPADELAYHADRADDLIRYSVSGNPWCDRRTLEKLSVDRYSYTRERAKEHPNAK